MLMIVGVLLFVDGVQKHSQLSLLFAGIAILAPIFYFVNWTVFLPLVPVIALALSLLVKKQFHTA
ncbi:hypothetical protein [Gracilibacillus phocaeensis]|uniref:hypothetical protein n=1 Tax=Gracilibacillus phocaeensis TaxID=2042304 RepID=UPI0008254B86|nr:hypothetical protein [Gracilibacillus phocaeensis]